MTDSSVPNQKKDDTSSSTFHLVFAVNNIKNCIPIVLDHDYGQYVSWVELFRIHAYAYNVLDHIEADTPRPSTVDKSTWERIDAVVKQWIYGTISEDLVQTIMKPGASAKELWVRIEEIFQKKKQSYVECLLSDFRNTRLKNFAGIEEYCEKVKEISNKLNNSGLTVTESQMVLQLASGLTNSSLEEKMETTEENLNEAYIDLKGTNEGKFFELMGSDSNIERQFLKKIRNEIIQAVKVQIEKIDNRVSSQEGKDSRNLISKEEFKAGMEEIKEFLKNQSNAQVSELKKFISDTYKESNKVKENKFASFGLSPSF